MKHVVEYLLDEANEKGKAIATMNYYNYEMEMVAIEREGTIKIYVTKNGEPVTGNKKCLKLFAERVEWTYGYVVEYE